MLCIHCRQPLTEIREDGTDGVLVDADGSPVCAGRDGYEPHQAQPRHYYSAPGRNRIAPGGPLVTGGSNVLVESWTEDGQVFMLTAFTPQQALDFARALTREARKAQRV